MEGALTNGLRDIMKPKSHTQGCYVIPARTDTKYWHNYVMNASEIHFVKGRLSLETAKFSTIPISSRGI